MWDKSHRGLGRRVPEFELWQAPGQNMLLHCIFVLRVEFHLMKGRNSSFWEVGRPEGPSGNSNSSNIFWDHFQLQKSRMKSVRNIGRTHLHLPPSPSWQGLSWGWGTQATDSDDRSLAHMWRCTNPKNTFIIHAISREIEGLGSGEQTNVNWAFVFVR